MGEVSLAFIGTGSVAESHLRGLAALEGVSYAGFCDADKSRADEAAKEFAPEAHIYDDWRVMLDELSFDACYVCVPPHAHEDMEIKLAEKGAHLFVEKPVNLRLEDAIRAREAIRKAGVMSCVGYSLRYMAATAQAEEFFGSHKAALARVRRWGGVPKKPWWCVMAESGGQLHEMVTHQIDLLRALMGEVEEVGARYSLVLTKDVEDFDIPDVQVMFIRFDSGALATVTASCAMQGVGVSEVDFIVEGKIVSWDAREGLKAGPEDAFDLPPLPQDCPGIDEAFVRALREKDASLIRTPFDEGVRSAEVTLAANESAKTGRMVKLERR